MGALSLESWQRIARAQSMALLKLAEDDDEQREAALPSDAVMAWLWYPSAEELTAEHTVRAFCFQNAKLAVRKTRSAGHH